jgi:uncharacterized membrane protein YidH (DUF202 family)
MNLMPGKIGSDLAGLLSFPLVIGAMGIFESALFPALSKCGLWFWFYLAILIANIGIALLAYAKFPLYQQRKFFTFGPRAIPDERKTAYKWAWLLVLTSVLLQLFLLIMI